ncbi:MAG TPA: DNA-binding protein [Candidatus Thermoplasmatota archaeon]|nr:DNA-binding protein [Candidatus Thermoplasmatota archaeon]
MLARDLKDKSKVDQLEVTVLKKEEPRSVNSRAGDALTVCDCEAVDGEGGKVKISLWNDEIERVSEGAKIRITNGWASAFRGEIKVSAGKFGKLEIL